MWCTTCIGNNSSNMHMYHIVSAGRTDVFSFVCSIICDRCGRPPGDHGEKRLGCSGSCSRTTSANLKK